MAKSKHAFICKAESEALTIFTRKPHIAGTLPSGLRTEALPHKRTALEAIGPSFGQFRSSALKTKILIVLAILAVIAAGGAYYVLQVKHPASPQAVPITPPPQPAAPTVVPAPPAAAPAECLLPGPPPVPPDGATATDADMKLGHDVIQAFVMQLEAYQACRNAQIDHAPAGTTDQQKQAWVQQGNAAVDEAHALADAFSSQLRLYHARTSKKP